MVSKRGNQLMGIKGFRFHPTDEELIGYLECKNRGSDMSTDEAINEVKMCDHEPWELPDKANQKSEGDRIFHFFSKPDLKFPDSQTSRSRDQKPIIKRSTKTGCWKPTGVDRVIKKNGAKIGIKKTLVFYGKKQPKGQKSNWVLHEYHSAVVSPNGIAYVVCKVKFREGNNASIDSSPWEVAHTSNLVDNAYHETRQPVEARLPPRANSLVPKGIFGYTDHTRGKSIAEEYIDIRSIDSASESETARKKGVRVAGKVKFKERKNAFVISPNWEFGETSNFPTSSFQIPSQNANRKTHQLALNTDQDGTMMKMMIKPEEEDELPAAATITKAFCNEISVSDYGFDCDSVPVKPIAEQYSQSHHKPSSEFQEASLDPFFGFDFPELPDPNVLNSDFDTLLGGDIGELGSVEASGIDPGLESLGDIGWDNDWFGLFD